MPDPRAHLAAAVALAPAAVGALLAQQERARAARVLAGRARLAGGERERLEREHGGVGEADAPAAVPTTIGALRVADVGQGARHDPGDLARAVDGVEAGEAGQGGDDGGGALRVVVLDHDAAEDLGRVELLQPLARALRLVAAEAAGRRVLHGQQRVDGAVDAAVGEEPRVARQVLQLEHGLERLARAVADRVALGARAEGPGALALLPVAVPPRLAVLQDLLIVKELQGAAEHGLEQRVVRQAGKDRGLDQKGRVPRLHAVGAVHHHALGADPQEVLQALAVPPQQVGIGPVVDEAGDGVHGRVDGAEIGVVAVLVLEPDELPRPGFRALRNGPHPEEGAPDVRKEPVGRVEKQRLGMVVVGIGNGVAVGCEIDRLERLDEEFLA